MELSRRSGQVVIPPSFTQVSNFNDGRALVEKDGRLGYIDASGARAIDAKSRRAKAFSNGLAPVLSERARYSRKITDAENRDGQCCREPSTIWHVASSGTH